MSDFLKIDRDGAVLTVTMDRPDDRNAITDPEQSAEFVALAEGIARDRTVRAMVLTGAGKSFCAGGNVKSMRDRTGLFAGSPFDQRTHYRTTVQTIGKSLWELEVPVVATRIPGCVDSVTDGLTGTLVPAGDATSLESAVARYLDDPDLRRRHGASGRRRVLAEFVPERIWSELAGLYRHVLQRRG